MIRATTFCAAALLWLPLQAWAEQPINERRPLNADGTLSVKSVCGEIQVQAWDKNEVFLTGYLGDGVEKLVIDGDSNKLRIEVKLPKNSQNVGDSLLQLHVPAGIALDLDSVSADTDVTGTRGPLAVNTVSGDLRLKVQSGDVSAKTVSGDLLLEAPSRDTKVNTVSGDLFVRGVRGKLFAETVSGNLHIEGREFSDMQLKSVSGDFEVEASLADQALVNLETLSGDVGLTLPKSTSANASFNTFSGELYSDFGNVKEGARSSRVALGSGGKSEINLHSFSGDIRLQRK
jgi:DUF4097 and DUF4098 domain-containing protein YvlB